ncbi:ankyrin repeat-containing domain protein [Daldinia vernicosa]|uniref:ankyrin repeat-containing domain protein n=1 Tax=Daldinia vernicosa TaxID=114800 RepID=UPI002008DA9A|nr:ankyrin repeat-containing domain protein [Daldinia vernicosa]KAI0849854.1 ankyrin repeat-containing domain protein [Daldinia vernicosa]
MLGPIFKQYRVLDLQDDTISAMTELGDIMTGIPVLDQSNLLGRLQQAFNNGLGSVRALVLIHGDRKLIVDMKVLSDSSLGCPPVLHEAILRSNKSVLEQILSKPEKINELDEEGRTALFSAVAVRREEVVDLLLQKNKIKVNIIDMYGRTALDVAVAADPSIAMRLLRNGASPIVGIDSGILNLLSASAEGHRAEVEGLLLDSGVDVNGCDRLGLTALHEAASFGHDSIVTQLIQHGADVNVRVALGKDTALHIAIRRDDNYRRFIGQGIWSKSTVLTINYIEVVKALLRNGATTSQRRHDGRTVEDLVTGGPFQAWFVRRSKTLSPKDSKDFEESP